MPGNVGADGQDRRGHGNRKERGGAGRKQDKAYKKTQISTAEVNGQRSRLFPFLSKLFVLQSRCLCVSRQSQVYRHPLTLINTCGVKTQE